MTQEQLNKEVDSLVKAVCEILNKHKIPIVTITLTHILREIIDKHLKDSQLVDALEQFQLGLIAGFTNEEEEETV